MSDYDRNNNNNNDDDCGRGAAMSRSVSVRVEEIPKRKHGERVLLRSLHHALSLRSQVLECLLRKVLIEAAASNHLLQHHHNRAQRAGAADAGAAVHNHRSGIGGGCHVFVEL